MLDIAILGLLMDRDHHGYEIRAQLRDRLGVWANVSFGSIYPALARLERHGFVEAVARERCPRLSSLSTGSLSGERASLRSLRATPGLGRRGRKVYRITEEGREEFVTLLSDPATLDDSKNFSLRMALAKYLTPESSGGPARAPPRRPGRAPWPRCAPTHTTNNSTPTPAASWSTRPRASSWTSRGSTTCCPPNEVTSKSFAREAK